jgi:hypothetical protein
MNTYYSTTVVNLFLASEYLPDFFPLRPTLFSENQEGFLCVEVYLKTKNRHPTDTHAGISFQREQRFELDFVPANSENTENKT